MPTDWHDSTGALTNTIGHAAGVLIFGIFLYLVFRQGALMGGTRDGAGFPLRRTPSKVWLPLVAAALALLWNLASLAVLVLAPVASERTEFIIASVGFSILSLLPAVLLQLCLNGGFPWLTRTGYALSAFAVGAHVAEFVTTDIGLHRIGLSVITIGFGALTVVASISSFWMRSRSSVDQAPSSTSRLLATMSLFLFAVSFIHFGDGHLNQAWSQELAFHHAGIPLALFVLMQEYRFILADAFIRFLANGLLAGVFGFLITAWAPMASLPVQVVIAAVAVAAFAWAREVVQGLLTRVVFHQPRRDRVERAMQALRAHYDDEATYLPMAAAQIAGLMNAPLIEVAAALPLSEQLLFAVRTGDLSELRELQRRGVRAVVPIRLSVGDARYVLLGERDGGRPYLSEDLDSLMRMAAAAAEQLEGIRAAETGRLVTEAELRALQAQIHPHFLFNALNTLYGMIPREASAARQTVLNLSDIFRYFLQSGKEFVPLEEEMRIVQAYLAIEAQRLGDKLQVVTDVDASLRREQIPVLSIQPLVENAVKHGVAMRVGGGSVRIRVSRDHNRMSVSIADDGPGFKASTTSRARAGTGVGLSNVTRRLRLCYGSDSDVVVESSSEGTTVRFQVPCQTVDVELPLAR
ncbi:MAG: histidine kinase [Acidobacteriota bacterium]